MADFQQQEQKTGSQQNAEVINNHLGITFEQYGNDLRQKEEEIRELIRQHTFAGYERDQLQKRLEDIEQKLDDECASYNAYINDLEERILRLCRIAFKAD